MLARLLEKIVVKNYLYPIITTGDKFSDQFAFRPRGSTTGALTCLMHKITGMLESCRFIRCLLIDFSKCFDTVDRSILLTKLTKFNIHPFIIRWISSLLSDRSQAVCVNGQLSDYSSINLGVIQGSGIGPSLFTILASDLHPIHTSNALVKFADDMTLASPEGSDIDIKEEFENIKLWAENNNLHINMLKTKEMVFVRPSPYPPLIPSPLAQIERIAAGKLLGVIFQ